MINFQSLGLGKESAINMFRTGRSTFPVNAAKKKRQHDRRKWGGQASPVILPGRLEK